MRALGDIIDIGTCFAPVNTADAFTGKRISMQGASSLTFVFFGAVGGAEDLTLDFLQHTAYTSGTSADLDATGVSTSRGLTEYYIKAETALDNDESWVRVTQTVASELTVVGATYGAQQKIVVAHIDATQIADGYSHVSVDGTLATSATAQLAGGLYILHGLRYRRRPDKLGNLLRPNVANA
jgi:hypothetical protein